MTRIVNLVVVGCLVVGVVGCASAPQMGTQSTSLPASKTALGKQPDWFKELPEDPDYFYAASTSISTRMQVAVTKATADGRGEIAQQIQLKVETLLKLFVQETSLGSESSLREAFSETNRQVTSEVMSFSKPKSTETVVEGKRWRAYVLIRFPIGRVSQALAKQIRSKEDLYTRFQATKAFEELDKEVEKFEDFKKSQSQP